MMDVTKNAVHPSCIGKEMVPVKRKLFFLLTLCLLVTAFPCAAEKMDKSALEQAALQDFPGWAINRSTAYGSGKWEGEIANYRQIRLVKVENSTLYFKTLEVMTNPLQKGDPIPWDVQDYAPIPLTEDLAEEMHSLIHTDAANQLTDYGAGAVIHEQHLLGCVPLVLEEGEKLALLVSLPGQINILLENEQGYRALAIVYWDGDRYTSIIRSPFQEEKLYYNEIHSGTEYMELYSPALSWELTFTGTEKGWRLASLNNGRTIFNLSNDYVIHASDFREYTNNHYVHYGSLPFDIRLENMDLSLLPDSEQELVDSLNAEGWACVKTAQAPLMDAPDGNAFAFLYTRAAGKIMAEKGDYVQLLFGSEETGITGWIHQDQLAFGKETETVPCAFPSYDRNDWYRLEDFSPLFPGAPVDIWPNNADVWLIGKTLDGQWLVQIEMDTVLTAPENAFTVIGPTEPCWEDQALNFPEYTEEGD